MSFSTGVAYCMKKISILVFCLLLMLMPQKFDIEMIVPSGIIGGYMYQIGAIAGGPFL